MHGPKTGTPEFFRTHLNAHEEYFAAYANGFIFRGPICSPDGRDNIGTALLLELSDRAAAEKFWNNEPFAKTAATPRRPHRAAGVRGLTGVRFTGVVRLSEATWGIKQENQPRISLRSCGLPACYHDPPGARGATL
jgi:uncharacterized protein YciI